MLDIYILLLVESFNYYLIYEATLLQVSFGLLIIEILLLCVTEKKKKKKDFSRKKKFIYKNEFLTIKHISFPHIPQNSLYKMRNTFMRQPFFFFFNSYSSSEIFFKIPSIIYRDYVYLLILRLLFLERCYNNMFCSITSLCLVICNPLSEYTKLLVI
ncbi:hypothetical protein PUN28_011508 [Cardiocondyla obscurior]|uniref:Uncharacterized protein n=1 Tax=Cardiocondyla obscurior TaxID=286306 RepID=A0AAW2FHZ9_9HYME